MNIIEKRTLPIGIEYEGRIHREMEVMPRIVKHLVDASAREIVVQNKNYFEISCMAEQIVKIGDIPKDKINCALILEMYSDDFDVLAEAVEKARQRAASFRSESTDQKSNSDHAQAGVSVE